MHADPSRRAAKGAQSFVKIHFRGRRFVKKNTEIGLRFARIRPRLWEQIRLDEFFLWDQVLSKKDETEGVSCKIVDNDLVAQTRVPKHPRRLMGKRLRSSRAGIYPPRFSSQVLFIFSHRERAAGDAAQTTTQRHDAVAQRSCATIAPRKFRLPFFI